MKPKSPICDECTREKLKNETEGKLLYLGNLFFAGEKDKNERYIAHERPVRNVYWYKGVAPIYMKRLYVREMVDGKQRFKPFGYTCYKCGKVIRTMRTNVKRSEVQAPNVVKIKKVKKGDE